MDHVARDHKRLVGLEGELAIFKATHAAAPHDEDDFLTGVAMDRSGGLRCDGLTPDFKTFQTVLTARQRLVLKAGQLVFLNAAVVVDVHR
jgi:hypothetical protein